MIRLNSYVSLTMKEPTFLKLNKFDYITIKSRLQNENISSKKDYNLFLNSKLDEYVTNTS